MKRVAVGKFASLLKKCSKFLFHSINHSNTLNNSINFIQDEEMCNVDNDIHNWILLRDFKNESGYLSSNGEWIWCNETQIPIGRKIYRGCRCYRKEDVCSQLNEPRFWSADKNTALNYSEWAIPNEKHEGIRKSFIISAEIISDNLFAEYDFLPLVGEIYSNRNKYGVEAIAPNDIQRLYGTEIAETLMKNNYDGVVDEKEILIKNYKIIKIFDIEEI